jgi:hypothetical protein
LTDEPGVFGHAAGKGGKVLALEDAVADRVELLFDRGVVLQLVGLDQDVPGMVLLDDLAATADVAGLV